MEDNTTLFEKVPLLRRMLPPSMQNVHRLCGEVNNDIFKSHGCEEQRLNPESYRAVVLAIASQVCCARVGKINPYRERDERAILTAIQNGDFSFLKSAGANVLEAVEAHLLQLQCYPPLTDMDTIRLQTTETARVMLRHLPREVFVPDPDALTRWEEDGGMVPP